MVEILSRTGLRSLVDSELPDGGPINPSDHRNLEDSLIDSLAHLGEIEIRVQNMTTTTPPGGATDRQAWVVGSGATGAWAGEDGKIAVWDDDKTGGGDWYIHTPVDGQAVWNRADDTVYRWDGDASPAAWVAQTGGGGGGTLPAAPTVLKLTADDTAQDYTGGPTAVPWDAAERDLSSPNNRFAGANPTRITVEAGDCVLKARLHFKDLTTSTRIFITIEGSVSGEVAREERHFSTGSGGGSEMAGLAVSAPISTSGEYFEVYLLVASDSSITIKSQSRFWVEMQEYS